MMDAPKEEVKPRATKQTAAKSWLLQITWERAMRLLDREYFPWKQVLNLAARLFRPKPWVVIAVRPALPATG